MSTNDVPGAKPANGDTLAMGCWAESEKANDESLIFVESTEGARVIFSVFDLARKPILEYRDSMPTDDFKRFFSFDGKNKPGGAWRWHDKTPFPWDRIIKAGAQDGPKYASADEQLSAAEEVRDHLRMRARNVDMGAVRSRAGRTERGRTTGEVIMARIREALDDLEAEGLDE